MDFVAIDFETANRRKDSACAIGIVAHDGGKEVASYYGLIKPPGKFSADNVAVHGITEDDVMDAPTAAELWPQIEHFFSPDWPIVAHNVPFDFPVLMSSFDLDMPGLWAIDTLQMCRDRFPGKHSLDVCADFYGIPLPHHHNALDDARACAGIMQAIAWQVNYATVSELFREYPQFAECHFASDIKKAVYKDKFAKYRDPVSVKDIQPSQPEINVCALTGKRIVFTGELHISRREAMQRACDAGAKIMTTVNKKTDYLICGKQDKALVGEDGLSSKQEKALALNATGANINIIREAEFILLLRSKEAMV